jgi:hypothetical protein
MCHNSGGEVRIRDDAFTLFPILDSTDRKRLARTCNDVVRETGQARQWRYFPADALAIGDNGCGDKLVFLPDPESQRFGNAVYWWDHETGELHEVTADFDEIA